MMGILRLMLEQIRSMKRGGREGFLEQNDPSNEACRRTQAFNEVKENYFRQKRRKVPKAEGTGMMDAARREVARNRQLALQSEMRGE